MTLYLAPLIIKAADSKDTAEFKQLCEEFRAVVGAWGWSDALILQECKNHVAKTSK